MPSTETFAANHGQKRSLGRPLRSASSTISMPRVSSVSALVDDAVAGTSVAIVCLLRAGTRSRLFLGVPEQDGSDDLPETRSGGGGYSPDLVGVAAGGAVLERLDGGHDGEAEHGQPELAGGDHLRHGGHADEVRAEGPQHPRLGDGLEVGAAQDRVDPFLEIWVG